jgi:hypothetical protein
MSDVAQPSDGPPEPPSDYRAFRRSYRWQLLYGPWALAVLGLALIGVGLLADRPGEVAVTAITLGVVMVLAGVLLPRMGGPVEIGTSGVKGDVESLPQALRFVDTGARLAAEQLITPGADKERKVEEVVKRVVEREFPQKVWRRAIRPGEPRTPINTEPLTHLRPSGPATTHLRPSGPATTHLRPSGPATPPADQDS